MSLFFHKTLLLASGWIYYCYSPYRLSLRFLYKRFKYFYRDFHRTYCFLPFILSPSPAIPLRPVSTSAKSLDPHQMSSHCLPAVAILHFLQLLHPCIPSSPPQHPGLLHASFPWSFVYICFLHSFPVALCCPSTILPSQDAHSAQQTHNYKAGSAGQASFNQRWEWKRRLWPVPHSVKQNSTGKLCLRPQALCYSSKFRHEILPCILLLLLAASHEERNDLGGRCCSGCWLSSLGQHPLHGLVQTQGRLVLNAQ